MIYYFYYSFVVLRGLVKRTIDKKTKPKPAFGRKSKVRSSPCFCFRRGKLVPVKTGIRNKKHWSQMTDPKACMTRYV